MVTGNEKLYFLLLISVSACFYVLNKEISWQYKLWMCGTCVGVCLVSTAT